MAVFSNWFFDAADILLVFFKIIFCTQNFYTLYSRQNVWSCVNFPNFHRYARAVLKLKKTTEQYIFQTR